MRFVHVFVAGLFVSLVSATASASPPANSCERTIEEIDQATTVVIATAKSVTATSKGTSWIVRATYTVDRALVGTKTAEIVVEDTCDTAPIPQDYLGYPAVARYCTDLGQHQLPGLTADGKPGAAPAALILVDGKSDLDGAVVRRVVHGNKWSGCPDEAALLKKRPALKDLVAKVKATNATTTFGLVPPPPSPAPSASASGAPPAPSSSAPAAPSVSASTPLAPSPPAAVPPPKSGGCSSTGASWTSLWPALAILAGIVARRRSRT